MHMVESGPHMQGQSALTIPESVPTSPEERSLPTQRCVCFVTFTSSQMETYRPYCSKPSFKIHASRSVSCKICACLLYWIEYLKYACLLERFLVWKKHTSTLFSFSSFLFDCTVFIVFNLALLWSVGYFWWSLPFHFPLLRAEFFNTY